MLILRNSTFGIMLVTTGVIKASELLTIFCITFLTTVLTSSQKFYKVYLFKKFVLRYLKN